MKATIADTQQALREAQEENALLREQLAAAYREIRALRAARDAALRLAVRV